MSCGTGECGCGCEELLHIHVKPDSDEMKVTVPPRESFATEALLTGSQVRPEES